MESPIERRSRNQLSVRAKAELRNWLRRHAQFPYPSDAEKREMCQRYGMTFSQINYWFINARRRYLSPRKRDQFLAAADYGFIQENLLHQSDLRQIPSLVNHFIRAERSEDNGKILLQYQQNDKSNSFLPDKEADIMNRRRLSSCPSLFSSNGTCHSPRSSLSTGALPSPQTPFSAQSISSLSVDNLLNNEIPKIHFPKHDLLALSVKLRLVY